MKKLLLLFVSSVAFAQTPNYFFTYLTTGIGTTDTTLSFTASDTTYISTNTTYYCTIWDTYYANSAEAYKAGRAEAILVNSRSGATLDVERGSLGTTARAFNTTGRRYRIDASIFSVQLLPAISGSNSGKYMTNDGSSVSWSSAVTVDSILAHRTYMGLNRDSLTSHNTRINGAIQRSLDSISQHRTEINTLTSLDSVDIPIMMNHSGSFNATSTFYTAIAGSVTGQATEANIGYQPCGLNGQIIGFYYQAKTNTMTANATITLMYGDTSAAALSASNLALTIAPGQKAKAITNQTLTVTPYMILGYRWVSSGGSGAMTLQGLTAILRVKKN